MDNMVRNSSASTRVSKSVKDKARKNLAKRGITLSEFLRFAVGKADDDIELLNFLDTPEALQGKSEVENGNVEKIGSLDDLDKWMDNL
ncbi:RelB [Lactobacillus taiwanensis]|uniref:RelB n=1 Tax=Lactobacillus taiwanensis TaxID=508451 RepID=UPI0025A969E6|nr:RelB [Lactobacillus taiwanensis]